MGNLEGQEGLRDSASMLGSLTTQKWLISLSISPLPQPHALPRGLEGASSFCPLKAVSSAEVGTTKSLKYDLVSFSSCNEAREFLKMLNFYERP